MTGSSDSRKGLIYQAGILAGASILVRVIGLLYRAPLTAIIGDEGNGYYNMAYNIYTIVLLISSYSVPSAISKVMASKLALGEVRNAQRVFHCALLYALAAGIIASLFLFFGAGALVSPGAVSVLRIFAPTVFIFGILGVLRGYFQAHGSMVQTSVSQILEQLMNAVMSIVAAYGLIYVASGKDPTTQARFGAMGSALGTGSGVVIALLYTGWCYYNAQGALRKDLARDRSLPEPFSSSMKETILSITPFILSSFILNLTTSLNQTIYVKTLIEGRSLPEVDITTQYGIFSTKAVVITNIPISIATAVSAAIIPSIAASFARRDMALTRSRASSVLRMTTLIAMPCMAGLIALAWPITLLLFPQQASLDMASILLALLSITVLFYSVSTVTNAILQSVGKIQMPLISASIALVIQTILLIVLLRGTDMGVYALVLVSVLYSVLIFVMNEWFLHRYISLKTNVLEMYIKPFVGSGLMGFCTTALYALLYTLLRIGGMESMYRRNLIAIGPSILFAVVFYLFIMIRMGAVTDDDVLAVPGGGRILRLLYRLRFFKR